jgi:hypothetical protein
MTYVCSCSVHSFGCICAHTMITYTYVCMQALTDAAAVAETEVTDATTLSIDDSEIEKLSKEALAYKQANTLEVHTHIHHYC